jgi:DNA-binding SARP family transcriptional activator
MRAETTSPTTAVAQQAEPVYLRVYTFGPFRIEWIDPSTGQATPLPAERLHGRGAAPSLALLKALLGRPDRFATRDWIMDQFWPESKRRSAEERLDDVSSSLRTLLRPEGSSAKLVQYVYGSDGRGAGYRLAGYPQVWCDADAFVWYVEHASLLDRMGQDSSACWQRAYELAARGMYLPEHLYEEWARARRETLEGLLRDCVQCWSQLLRQAGHVDEAIRRLRTYWEERPTDEDALRVLLELLGERERFAEAEACYAKAEAALAEDGHAPDPRTREMIEVVRALQIQRRSLTVPILQKQAQRTNFLAPTTIIGMNTIGISTIRQPDLLGKEVEDAPLSPSDFPALSENKFGPEYISSPYLINSSPDDIQDILTIFEELLEASWELSQGSKLKAARNVLWPYLPKVAEIALRFPEYQQRAASLAAQGYILAAPLASHHNGDLYSRRFFSEQALIYAQMTQNPNLCVAALRALGVTFDYQKRPLRALETYQQAIPYLDQVSPLLHSRICALLAGAYAKVGQKQEAFDFLNEAYHTFPENPQSDISFRYADAGYFTLIIWNGAVHLDTQQPKQALEIFSQARESLSQKGVFPKRIQSELLLYQTRALTMLRDLEAASLYLIDAVKAAVALRSEMRYQQAYEIFSQLQMMWPHEPRVLSLREVFQR